LSLDDARDNPEFIEGLLCCSAWAYDFSNVSRFFAGCGADLAGSARRDGYVYLLPHAARDLVDGINVPGRNPTSPRPADPNGLGGLFTFG
jgi:hypothetical protein